MDFTELAQARYSVRTFSDKAVEPEAVRTFSDKAVEPEELFDLLLTDYQDFELLCRTKGRREVTEADEKAVEELCQPYLDWRKKALK